MNTPIKDALNAQGVLQPGQKGLWKVWGAHAGHIRAGDFLMLKWEAPTQTRRGTDWSEVDNGIREYKVAEVDHSTAWLPKVTACTGETFRVGGLQPIVLLREGTGNTLAD